MNKQSILFENETDLLNHCLANVSKDIAPKSIKLTSSIVELWELGVVCCFPKHEPNANNGLILSSGIHGNETAPIELLNQLVTEIIQEKIAIQRPILIILGHPEAMKEQQRFIQFNMNRLFLGAHKKPQFKTSTDAKRAALIERMLKRFHKNCPIKEHFDLHTAIRQSKFERFALYPYSKEGAKPKSKHLELLKALGIQALVKQSSRSNTFSSHTANLYGAESYTLELGQVHPFGKNNLGSYDDVMACLRASINMEKTHSKPNALPQYEVSHEILNTEASFKLNIAEDVYNFEAFPKGYTVWQDSQNAYRVQSEYEYVIFPNSKVPIGQRAGLMIRRIQDDSHS